MSRSRTVLLIQLPIPPLGPQPIRGNVPLAAGYLKLLARRRGLEDRFEIDILPAADANRMGDQELVEEIIRRGPFLVGFTCYLWNIDRSLWIAAQVRRRRPDIRILIGGPEIASDNRWVLESGAYDFAAIGEGEQTFTELLSHLAGGAASPPAIPGLACAGGRLSAPRTPMPDLDPISSPYLSGILNAGDQEQLLLETIRGCIFKCKFCYYPKAYDGLYYISRDKILANLAHGREHGAREVYLLDPTLNQRRDYTDFLRVLKEGNPDGRLEYYGELRAEGITAEQANLMREANFKEVEIGLQSIDPGTQELMERRNNLKAFEKGIRALQQAGVHVKVDLIVGLPGDTADSVRRGMRYLADNRLYDDIQVFQLSILPGTSFRQEAAALGLEFQPKPPYYVLKTPDLTLPAMLELLEKAEEIFDTSFDPEPEPSLGWDGPEGGAFESGPLESGALDKGDRRLAGMRIDLDGEPPPGPDRRPSQAFTLWFRARDPYARLERMESIIRGHLESNPFTTLQVVLETGEDFPFNVFQGLQSACRRAENIYLDRFYEFTPGTPASAQRVVVLLPESARGRIDPDWVHGARSHADIVWNEERPGARRSLQASGQPGEWRWTAPAPSAGSRA